MNPDVFLDGHGLLVALPFTLSPTGERVNRE
jgi:hypothetical protein